MAEKTESIKHRLSSAQDPASANTTSVNAIKAEATPVPANAVTVSQPPKHPGHQRKPTFFDKLFSSEIYNSMYKKTDLSVKIQASFIVGDDLAGEDSPPYVRI